MTDEPIQRQCDLSFSVPFLHRLRFTDDICGRDFGVLLELLDGGEQGRARVLVVTETALEASGTALVGRLRGAESVELVAEPLRIEGGEDSKNSVDTIRYLLQQFNAANLDRRSYVVAIGGGAMLDAVGFAAAIAHRGIRLVRLPTTTLAQADSGVGVKNAINFFDKKNWIGTFAVPWAVCNDLRILDSLPDRDFCSGFSEAVKVALLKDPQGFDWLCDHAQDVGGRHMKFVQAAIHRSCMLHLRHITAGGDPFEMLEARPLDFGHWSAHRLEPLTQFQLRHGEAVALGVAIDCIYSTRMFGFPEQDTLRVCRCLSQLGMHLWHPLLLPAERLMQGLEEFRQHLGGRLTITMLRRVGEPINVHEIDTVVMKESIESLQEYDSRCQSREDIEIEQSSIPIKRLQR